MATGSLVPYSNPAGNNQTTPTTATKATATSLPTTATSTTQGATVPSSSVATPASSQADSELGDIFGTGVGGEISSYMNSISGTDSAILQDYVKSLQPQMATAQAQTNAALGAGGVSANSSVAGIADANLQSQEFASIAGESANLTDQAMQTESGMIEAQMGEAANYTAEQSALPWELAGAGIGAAGKIASSIISKGASNE